MIVVGSNGSGGGGSGHSAIICNLFKCECILNQMLYTHVEREI